LDELYKEMKAQSRKQTDFAAAARMVKRFKRRMIKLKAAIAWDQRFILIPSESHSGFLQQGIELCGGEKLLGFHPSRMVFIPIQISDYV
jgi:hypothetical protein